ADCPAWAIVPCRSVRSGGAATTSWGARSRSRSGPWTPPVTRAAVPPRWRSAHGPLGSGLPGGQLLGEHRGLAEVRVLGGGEQGEGLLPRPLPQPGQLRRWLRLGELGAVAARELREPLRVVPVPLAQLGGGGHLLAPLIQVGRVLAQPARPHPVHQDPDAIFRQRRVVDPTHPYPWSAHTSNVCRTMPRRAGLAVAPRSQRSPLAALPARSTPRSQCSPLAVSPKLWPRRAPRPQFWRNCDGRAGG